MTKFLKFPAVMELTGRSRASVYRDVAAGTFPKPLKIGKRAIAWHETDIRDWMSSRPTACGSD